MCQVVAYEFLLVPGPAEVLPGVLFVHVVQREFEDLMKVAD